MQTISFLYDDYRKVQSVLADLEKSGISSAATTLVARDADERYRSAPTTGTVTDEAAFGAIVGGLAGLGLGALIGIGAFELPGFGPLVASGILATSAATGLGGAVMGWLTGALMYYVYAKADRPDCGTVVSVCADDERAASIEAIMRRYSAVPPPERLNSYRDGGWTIHDSLATNFVPAEISRQRNSFWL